MKSLFIILSLLLFILVISKNEALNEESEKIHLDFGSFSGFTNISIQKNVTYYSEIDNLTIGNDLEFELTIDDIKVSPFTKFGVRDCWNFVDTVVWSFHNIEFSQKQKGNELVLIGRFENKNSCSYKTKTIEFVSSCDIPNLLIKATIVSSIPPKKNEDSKNTFTIVIIIILIVVFCISGCIVAIIIKCCKLCQKQNSDIKPEYAPIQPLNQVPQQNYPYQQ